MSNRPSNESVTIEQSLLVFLNTWPDKPFEIKLDELEKRDSSMMFQPLSGVKKIRKYVNGSYNGEFTFAVYVRAITSDTKTKLNARRILTSLDEWMSEKNEKKEYINLPALSSGNTAIKIEMTSTPSIAASYDNGTDDYQAIFTLSYKHKEEK